MYWSVSITNYVSRSSNVRRWILQKTSFEITSVPHYYMSGLKKGLPPLNLQIIVIIVFSWLLLIYVGVAPCYTLVRHGIWHLMSSADGLSRIFVLCTYQPVPWSREYTFFNLRVEWPIFVDGDQVQFPSYWHNNHTQLQITEWKEE
jgi:hypothetical protein